MSGYEGPTPFEDPVDCLRRLTEESLIRLPCDIDDVFWIENRYPVFSEILKNEKTSEFLAQLFDRVAYTSLVVDALLPGKSGLYLARVTDDMSVLQAWLNRSNMNSVDLTIRSMRGGKVMLARLSSYVFNERAD